MNDSNHPDRTKANSGGPARKIDVATAIRIADGHLQQGRIDQARQLCLRILQVAPNQIDAVNLLAIIATESGDHAEAERRFRETLQLKPHHALLHYNLGLAQAEQGKMDDAMASYRAALRLDPGLTAAKINLGSILRQRGAPHEALQCYREAVQAEPNDAMMHNNLGNVLRDLGRHEEALASFHRALELSPDYFQAYNNLGHAYLALDRLDEAADSFRHAVDLRPGHGPALNNLGIVLGRQGKLDESIACYQSALYRDPDFVQPYRHLAMTKKFKGYDEDIKNIERALERSGIPSDKLHLHFALGKAFEDLGHYDQSFTHYAEGNRLFRSTFEHDSADDEQYFATIKRVFSHDLFERWTDSGCPDTTPIFVVGMPRSGTTLVEQILAAHPRVHGGGEMGELRQAFLSNPKTSGLRLVDLPSQLEREDFHQLGSRYVELIRQHCESSDYIVNKRPQNFFFLGIIKLILPKAKVIHCRRDPLDTCLSIFTRHFEGKHKYAYNMTELGQYYRLYRDLMGHWSNVMPGVVFDIDYEALVAEQEGSTRRLLDFCGLPWDETCLSFHDLKRPVKTASAAQVRKPLYRSSIGRWRHYENHLGPLRDALGLTAVQDETNGLSGNHR